MGSRRDAGRGVTCTTRCSSTCTSAHLKVALRLADHDHRQRPNGSTGRLLATVLHAIGHHERAQTLTAALEQRRQRALSTVRDQLTSANRGR